MPARTTALDRFSSLRFLNAAFGLGLLFQATETNWPLDFRILSLVFLVVYFPSVRGGRML